MTGLLKNSRFIGFLAKQHFQKNVSINFSINLFIDEKDEERERARLSRDGEGRTPPRSSLSRLGVEGVGGAPFAVTAEPRSLSLFIFLVDEQILKII